MNSDRQPSLDDNLYNHPTEGLPLSEKHFIQNGRFLASLPPGCGSF